MTDEQVERIIHAIENAAATTSRALVVAIEQMEHRILSKLDEVQSEIMLNGGR